MIIEEENVNHKILCKWFIDLAKIPTLSEISQRDIIYRFMKDLGKLYIIYYQFHLGKLRDLNFISSETLKKNFPLIKKYRRECEMMAKTINCDIYEQWTVVCRDRTNIEAFIEMFGDITGYLETQSIEETMQNLKEDYSVPIEKIPKNIPDTHWWWFT